MKKTLILFLIVLCFIATATTSAPQSQVYITHVTVINTDTGERARDQTVVISDGKIADVAKSESLAVPVSARIVDGRDKYLIPGLWDMHVHTWDYESTYPLYIANGVTGVRDMFGPPEANKFRRELAKKQLLAPHFYLASPIVDGQPPVWPGSIEVTTPEQGRKVVDDQQHNGADFIKVYSRLAPDAYFAIAAESARVGIPFEGHVPLRVSAWKASEAKQKSFEHLNGIAIACSTREEELQAKMLPMATRKERKLITADGAQSYSESKCNDFFARLKANSNWQVPTLTVISPKNWSDPQLSHDPRLRYFGGEYRDWLTAKNDFRLKGWTSEDLALERQQFEFDKKLVGAMFRAGVLLLAGTDTGNPYCFPGFSLHDELALLVESGLTPLAALQTATRNPAIFMNATDRYGSISEGKIADLVLLDANPLQDIHNTTKIAEVFLSGKEFDRSALDRMLRSAEEQANKEMKPASQETTNQPSATPSQAPETPQASPEMQRLLNAQVGSWSQRLERPDGSSGEGEAFWQPGPGGMSLVENEYVRSSAGEMIGLSVTWWDEGVKGYRALWCDNKIKNGCLVMSKPAHWEGDQFVLRDEFERNGRKLVYKEVESEITPSTYTLTSYIGEPGSELKPTSTIHATRITAGDTELSNENALQQVFAADEARRLAMLHSDVSGLDSLLADDVTIFWGDGTADDKASMLALLRSGRLRYSQLDYENTRVRLFGRTAVVTGQARIREQSDSERRAYVVRVTRVYAHQQDRWRLVASQTTRVEPIP